MHRHKCGLRHGYGFVDAAIEILVVCNAFDVVTTE